MGAHNASRKRKWLSEGAEVEVAVLRNDGGLSRSRHKRAVVRKRMTSKNVVGALS